MARIVFTSRGFLRLGSALLALGVFVPTQTDPLAAGDPERVQAIFAKHCTRCHGDGRLRGGIDLVRHRGLAEHDRVVPGDPEASKLYQAITHGTATPMPPKEAPLAAAEIAVVRAWILAGAKPPRSATTAKPTANAPLEVTASDRNYWAFRPLKNPTIPAPPDDNWSRNPIDKFVLMRLRDRGLTPSPRAPSRTLLRRMSYGVRGLPPTPEERTTLQPDTAIARFLNDPTYGERWGRHWLDVARFAESTGYEADQDRRYAYKYRDAVIRSLNADLPFDAFVRRQLAGDELHPDDPEAIALTGFLAAGPTITNEGGDRVKYDKLDDVVGTIGSAFLGLTISCARCHDHKYDAISIRDYYALVGVFLGCREQDVPLTAAAREQRKTLQDDLNGARRAFNDWRNAKKEQVRKTRIEALPISSAERTLLLAKKNRKNRPQAELLKRFRKELQVSDRDMQRTLSAREKAEMQQLRQQQDDLNRKLRATDSELGRVMSEGNRRPATNFLLLRGDFRRKSKKLAPAFPAVLMRPGDTVATWTPQPPKEARTPWLRRGFAKWLTDAEAGAGALVARVIVNRLWQHHFGKGLVRTAGNFGITGDAPSHPELLDWLAAELIRGNWRLKRIHALILDSATYRQGRPEGEGVRRFHASLDPDNRLLWYRPARRIEAEAWRDSVLAVSGTLNREMFGPSIKPWIPTDAIATGSTRKWPTNVKDGPKTWRRSIYIYTKRSMLMPMLEALDLPDSTLSCSVRNQTTTPPAALLMMNNAFLRDQAGHLARRLRTTGDTAEAWIENAYSLALGRRPSAHELGHGKRFLSGTAAGDRLTDYCQVLLSLNEFLYVD